MGAGCVSAGAWECVAVAHGWWLCTTEVNEMATQALPTARGLTSIHACHLQVLTALAYTSEWGDTCWSWVQQLLSAANGQLMG